MEAKDGPIFKKKTFWVIKSVSFRFFKIERDSNPRPLNVATCDLFASNFRTIDVVSNSIISPHGFVHLL